MPGLQAETPIPETAKPGLQIGPGWRWGEETIEQAELRGEDGAKYYKLWLGSGDQVRADLTDNPSVFLEAVRVTPAADSSAVPVVTRPETPVTPQPPLPSTPAEPAPESDEGSRGSDPSSSPDVASDDGASEARVSDASVASSAYTTSGPWPELTPELMLTTVAVEVIHFLHSQGVTEPERLVSAATALKSDGHPAFVRVRNIERRVTIALQGLS
jgi:hypothetical protein